MNDSFKTFYKKTTPNKPDQSASDEILEIAKQIYSKKTELTPEELFSLSSEAYLQTVIEDVKEKMNNSFVYVVDEIRKRFPQKINNDKEVKKL